MKYYIIYKTTCKVTEKYYIGMHCTDDLDDGYLGSGKLIKLSIEKYGEAQHTRTVLEFHKTFEDMCTREKAVVTEDVLSDPMCMNLRVGGDGGWMHINSSPVICKKKVETARSQEFRDKRRQEQLDRWSDAQYRESFYQTVRSDEYKLSRSEQMSKIYQDPALLEKMKQMRLGEKNPVFGKKWVYKGEVSAFADINTIDTLLADGWALGRRKDLGIGRKKK